MLIRLLGQDDARIASRNLYFCICVYEAGRVLKMELALLVKTKAVNFPAKLFEIIVGLIQF